MSAPRRLNDGRGDHLSGSCQQEAAQHWRTMAVQVDLLERDPSYRMLRARTEE